MERTRERGGEMERLGQFNLLEKFVQRQTELKSRLHFCVRGANSAAYF